MRAHQKIHLVPFDAAVDLPRLATWLAKPHVSPWWPDPEHHLEKARLPAAGGGQALLLVDDLAAGYLRWQRAEADVVARLGIPVGSVDVDILLGEPDLLGRGVGPAAVQALLQQLFSDSSIPMIGMAVSTANARAIRAFKKAGLSELCEYEDDRYGRCVVLSAYPPGPSAEARRFFSASGFVVLSTQRGNGPTARSRDGQVTQTLGIDGDAQLQPLPVRLADIPSDDGSRM